VLVSDWEKSEKSLEEAHEKKLEEDMTKWENSCQKQTKYTSKLINDQKILNELIKQEKY